MPSLVRKASAGVISGFAIDLSPENTDVHSTPAMYTIDDAMAEIQRIRQVLDPENIRLLQERIFQHTLDRNNPHRTTIGDLILDVTRDALLDYMPGTAPRTAPTYALIAALADCAALTTVRTTPVLALDATGYLTEVAPHTPILDWGSGQPRLMAWAARSNLLTSSTPIDNPIVTGLDTTLYTQNISSLRAPDRSTDYLLVKDQPTQAVHGIQLTLPTVSGTEYVSSLYLYPWAASGYITLSLGTTETSARVDIATGTITYGDAVIGYLETYITGWWRIGLQYVADTTGDQTLDVFYSPDDTTQAYLGQENDIFLVAGLMHGVGAGLGPYIPTTSGPAGVAATTYTLPIGDALSPAAGMLALTTTIPRSLQVGAQPILSNTATLLERDGAILELTLSNSGPTLTAPLPDGILRHAYSYSATDVRQLGTTKPRQAIAGTYTAMPTTTTMTIHPSGAAFDLLTLYGHAENGYALDFLTGINSQ